MLKSVLLYLQSDHLLSILQLQLRLGHLLVGYMYLVYPISPREDGHLYADAYHPVSSEIVLATLVDVWLDPVVPCGKEDVG